MSGVLARVRDKALSPRVVQPSEGSGNKSWSCSTEVITDLTRERTTRAGRSKREGRGDRFFVFISSPQVKDENILGTI